MSTKYILDGKKPIPADLTTWANWFETYRDKRIVGRDQVGDVDISTVFLSIDHQFGDGPPLLFETMIFGGAHDQRQTRCSTWAEAEDMHRRAVAFVKAGLS
jgi:hypothetical protein